ncbi:MAG: hypothetical protein HOG49_12815 [Candidatus Scalindua sp.]|jgi:hypothetical protein|nr:hypothetical protein [Candidatus Scalindua sp.]
MERIITEEYLIENPTHIFVFGDNLLRKGKKGASELRDLPNVLGFITKKYPNYKDSSYYHPEEYKTVFENEFDMLTAMIQVKHDNIFLISKLGSGLANKYGIWEKIICNRLKELIEVDNVEFLFDFEN